MQVYVVECGEYDDKHIVAIFTTRVEAERCAEATGNVLWESTDQSMVSPWEVDPILPYPEHPRWRVVINSEKRITSCRQTPFVLDTDAIRTPMGTVSYDGLDEIHVACNAPDEGSAGAIAIQEWETCMAQRAKREARLRAEGPPVRKVRLP